MLNITKRFCVEARKGWLLKKIFIYIYLLVALSSSFAAEISSGVGDTDLIGGQVGIFFKDEYDRMIDQVQYNDYSYNEVQDFSDYFGIGFSAGVTRVRKSDDEALNKIRAEIQKENELKYPYKSFVWLRHTIGGYLKPHAPLGVPLGPEGLYLKFDVGLKFGRVWQYEKLYVDLYNVITKDLWEKDGYKPKEILEDVGWAGAKNVLKTLSLPINWKKAAKLHIGDMVSTEGHLTFFVDGKIGYGVDITDDLGSGFETKLNFGPEFGLYYAITGTFKRTVIKEKGDFVRVIIESKREHGMGSSFKVSAAYKVKWNKMGALSPQLGYTFFSIDVVKGKTFTKRTALQFRYDLSKDDGKKAYDEILKGNLAYSQYMFWQKTDGVESIVITDTHTVAEKTFDGLKIINPLYKNQMVSQQEEVKRTYPSGNLEEERNYRVDVAVDNRVTNNKDDIELGVEFRKGGVTESWLDADRNGVLSIKSNSATTSFRWIDQCFGIIKIFLSESDSVKLDDLYQKLKKYARNRREYPRDIFKLSFGKAEISIDTQINRTNIDSLFLIPVDGYALTYKNVYPYLHKDNRPEWLTRQGERDMENYLEWGKILQSPDSKYEKDMMSYEAYKSYIKNISKISNLKIVGVPDLDKKYSLLRDIFEIHREDKIAILSFMKTILDNSNFQKFNLYFHLYDRHNGKEVVRIIDERTLDGRKNPIEINFLD